MMETELLPKQRSATWSTLGLFVAFVAFIAAVLSPWIMDTFALEKKPIIERTVDVATKIKDRLIAKAQGKAFVPKAVEEKSIDVEKWYPPTTISIGLFAVCLGVVGFTRHESSRMSASAVAVGLAAIVCQYSPLLAAAIILVLLIGSILSALEIDLPTP